MSSDLREKVKTVLWDEVGLCDAERANDLIDHILPLVTLIHDETVLCPCDTQGCSECLERKAALNKFWKGAK